MTAAAPTIAAPAAAPSRVLGNAPAGVLYLAAFAAAAVAAGLGRAVTTTFLPVLLHQVKDAPGLIGTVMLVNAAAGFLVPLVVGVWSDRRGGRRMAFITGGSVVTAGGLAALALGSESSYLVLTVFGAASYVGLNAITTAHRALVADSFAPSGRARATSVQELALLVGSLLGVAVGGSLTAYADWAPFALAAVVVPVLAVPTVLRVRGRATAAEPAEAAERERVLAYYGHAAARPEVRNFLVAHVLWVLGYAAMPVFFVLSAERVLELTAAVASIWLVGFGIVTAATMVATGRVKDPARHRPLLLVGVAAMGAGFLALGFSSSMVVVGAAFALAAAGFGVISTVGFPLFSALIPEGEEGGYTALYFSVRAIASPIALPTAGGAIEATGSYRALFLLGGLATLAALVPLLATRPTDGASRKPRAVRLPSARWLKRSALELAAVAAAVLGTAALLVWTPLHEADEWLYGLINGLGPANETVLWVLDPHTRNYLVLIGVAAAAALFAPGRPVLRAVALVFGSAILSWGLLEGAYAVWDRARPEEVVGDAILNGHTWAHIESYPSGHMAITAALAVAAALAFPRLRPILFAYVAVVAFTRVFFGAHFPLDTLAGIAIGTVSARVLFSLFVELGLLERQRSKAAATRTVSRAARNELGAPS